MFMCGKPIRVAQVTVSLSDSFPPNLSDDAQVYHEGVSLCTFVGSLYLLLGH